jgi:hypothetical protein
MKHGQFKIIHDYCQTLTPKIGRNQIIRKIKEVTGEQKLRTIKVPLETSVTRGYFLSSSNTEHPFVKANGFHVIVLARGLNECWERFVNVKEAMHLLDDDGELTDSTEKFERLLADFASPSLQLSQQAVADIAGIWMALTCFCPESSRVEFQALLKENQIDSYGIALQLKVPEQYVPLLFSPAYSDVLKMLRGE